MSQGFPDPYGLTESVKRLERLEDHHTLRRTPQEQQLQVMPPTFSWTSSAQGVAPLSPGIEPYFSPPSPTFSQASMPLPPRFNTGMPPNPQYTYQFPAHHMPLPPSQQQQQSQFTFAPQQQQPLMPSQYGTPMPPQVNQYTRPPNMHAQARSQNNTAPRPNAICYTHIKHANGIEDFIPCYPDGTLMLPAYLMAGIQALHNGRTPNASQIQPIEAFTEVLARSPVRNTGNTVRLSALPSASLMLLSYAGSNGCATR